MAVMSAAIMLGLQWIYTAGSTAMKSAMDLFEWTLTIIINAIRKRAITGLKS